MVPGTRAKSSLLLSACRWASDTSNYRCPRLCLCLPSFCSPFVHTATLFPPTCTPQLQVNTSTWIRGARALLGFLSAGSIVPLGAGYSQTKCLLCLLPVSLQERQAAQGQGFSLVFVLTVSVSSSYNHTKVHSRLTSSSLLVTAQASVLAFLDPSPGPPPCSPLSAQAAQSNVPLYASMSCTNTAKWPDNTVSVSTASKSTGSSILGFFCCLAITLPNPSC